MFHQRLRSFGAGGSRDRWSTFQRREWPSFFEASCMAILNDFAKAQQKHCLPIFADVVQFGPCLGGVHRYSLDCKTVCLGACCWRDVLRRRRETAGLCTLPFLHVRSLPFLALPFTSSHFPFMFFRVPLCQFHSSFHFHSLYL